TVVPVRFVRGVVPHMGRFALVSVVLAASLASACGTATPASAPSRTRASSTRLRITILPGFVANATTVQYRLTCGPPSGTVPDSGPQENLYCTVVALA